MKYILLLNKQMTTIDKLVISGLNSFITISDDKYTYGLTSVAVQEYSIGSSDVKQIIVVYETKSPKPDVALESPTISTVDTGVDSDDMALTKKYRTKNWAKMTQDERLRYLDGELDYITRWGDLQNSKLDMTLDQYGLAYFGESDFYKLSGAIDDGVDNDNRNDTRKYRPKKWSKWSREYKLRYLDGELDDIVKERV